MLCFSLLEYDGLLFSFTKVQVKGEVLKAVRNVHVTNLLWSPGLTDIRGNVLKNGRRESTKPLVVQTFVDIVSVGTLCVKTCHSCTRLARNEKTLKSQTRQLLVLINVMVNRASTLLGGISFSKLFPFCSKLSHTYSHRTQSFAALRKIPDGVMTGKFFVLAS